VILPDVNLLLYAHNEAAPGHARAREWLEDIMTRRQPTALAWAVALGFVRLLTHRAVLAEPLEPAAALDRIDAIVRHEHVQILEPGPRHLVILRDLFTATGVAASLTTDTHLAALAIEYQCELHSNDADFARFPGLRWTNPISG